MAAALPFALVAAVVTLRVMVGPGWGLLSLLALAPATAAIVGGIISTLAAGASALGVDGILDLGVMPRTDHRAAEVTLIVVAGVTGAAVLGIRARERRDAELRQVRAAAEAAQNVLLRPVPPAVNGIRLAVSYVSASSGALVGGDLYEAVPTPDGVRLIVGDVQGKGLPALQTAAAVLGVFREAAREPGRSLAAVVARVEATLARDLRDEQFVTAVLAEIRPARQAVQILNCGHPLPLVLGPGGHRFAGQEVGSLPLGMTRLARADRVPFTVPLAPGEGILLYTDGATEARARSGEFFTLPGAGPPAALGDPGRYVAALRDQVARHVGHALDDDLTLLLAYFDPAAQSAPAAAAADAMAGPARRPDAPARTVSRPN